MCSVVICILIAIICFFYGSVARFLESRGMIEDALDVATDPDYRFDLAIQLGRLEVAKVSSQVHTCLQADITCKILWLGDLIFFISCLNEFDLSAYAGSNVHSLFLQGIATEVQSESKWKQLGELAMSTGKVFFFENESPNFVILTFVNISVQIYWTGFLMMCCWIWPCIQMDMGPLVASPMQEASEVSISAKLI